MTNIATLSIRPEAWNVAATMPTGGFFNLADPTFFPRWLHFVLASLALAGLFLALIKSRAAGQGDDDAREAMRLAFRAVNVFQRKKNAKPDLPQQTFRDQFAVVTVLFCVSSLGIMESFSASMARRTCFLNTAGEMRRVSRRREKAR